MKVEISVTRAFEAAHYLPALPDGHKCKRTHGHNYTIELVILADINQETGMGPDYAYLDQALDEQVINVCDHRLLNDIPGLENPTGEMIAIWALERLRQIVPGVLQINVWETPNYRATAFANVR